MKYTWQAHKSLTGVKAETVGKHLETIRQAKGGILTADAVVKDARKKSSPIHSAFEWDNTAAARAYRLVQAQYLIRSVVVYVDGVETSAPVRAFVQVTDDDNTHYTSIEHAMGTAELRQQIVARAWAELQAWQVRYNDLQEFARIRAAIDDNSKPKRKRKAG